MATNRRNLLAFGALLLEFLPTRREAEHLKRRLRRRWHPMIRVVGLRRGWPICGDPEWSCGVMIGCCPNCWRRYGGRKDRVSVWKGDRAKLMTALGRNQNALQMKRLSATAEQMINHLTNAVKNPTNVVRTYTNQWGTYGVRESLFAGASGQFAKFESTWEVTRQNLENPHKQLRSMVELRFPVRNTPTKRAQMHRTVVLPHPVTEKDANAFNTLFNLPEQ